MIADPLVGETAVVADMGNLSCPQRTADTVEPWLEIKRLALRLLPDSAICRARTAGFGDYADCQVKNPIQCRHALSFGGGFLCLHPERTEIVLRTADLHHAAVQIS